MKICVWRTGHEIADTVANAVMDGLPNADLYKINEPMPECDLHICYGILRGGTDVFRYASKNNTPFINIDRGYWKPGHYDGYYRISLNGTQQTTGLDKLEPDYERWEQLGLEILPGQIRNGFDLICPPTDAVTGFFGYSSFEIDHQAVWRNKDCQRPLADDLAKAKRVITFNSSVGWEALRQGIPVISDPIHSIVGAWQKQFDKENLLDLDNRLRLFATMASLQLTLEEIRSGLLWPLIQKLIHNAGLHRA